MLRSTHPIPESQPESQASSDRSSNHRIQPSNELASALFECIVVVPAHSCILASLQYSDYIWITLLVNASDLQRIIRRCIVTDDDLKREIRYLGKDAVKSSGKPWFQIKCCDRNTNQRGHSHLQGGTTNSCKRLPANTASMCLNPGHKVTQIRAPWNPLHG